MLAKVKRIKTQKPASHWSRRFRPLVQKTRSGVGCVARLLLGRRERTRPLALLRDPVDPEQKPPTHRIRASTRLSVRVCGTEPPVAADRCPAGTRLLDSGRHGRGGAPVAGQRGRAAGGRCPALSGLVGKETVRPREDELVGAVVDAGTAADAVLARAWCCTPSGRSGGAGAARHFRGAGWIARFPPRAAVTGRFELSRAS